MALVVSQHELLYIDVHVWICYVKHAVLFQDSAHERPNFAKRL